MEDRKEYLKRALRHVMASCTGDPITETVTYLGDAWEELLDELEDELEAEEIAAAIVFLASDDANYITGASLDVNGGLFMG